MPWFRGGHEFAQYVSVAERRARARRAAEKIEGKTGTKTGSKTGGKDKRKLAPVELANSRKVAETFWGKAWCQHLESYSDYASRLPRGRSYLRHGAVIDLQISAGKVTGLVVGTATYKISVTIRSLDPSRWKEIASACTGKVDSLIDLLKGNLSAQVMEVVTHRERGLFPGPGQIELRCSCPDWAEMCKHVAAVLYGIGARLDQQPELLFTLRDVDHRELISAAAEGGAKIAARSPNSKRKVLKNTDLSALFGIEIDADLKSKK
jgi:uncharacterized Zn finger protein